LLLPDANFDFPHTVDSKITAPVLQEYIQAAVAADPKLYGGYSAELCVRTFLYWLCTSSSYKKIEKETDMPKSNMKQIFGALRGVLLPMSEESVKTLTYEQRKEIADAEISDADFTMQHHTFGGRRDHST
jgi:hypothetical protein